MVLTLALIAAVIALAILTSGARLTDVTYPTQLELREIEQVLLPTLTEDDPVFDEFPVEEADSTVLRWEQKDNYTGLSQVRGLNGAPKFVRPVGAKSYEFKPGVYGEFGTIDEDELTRRRQLGSIDNPVSIDDLVGGLAELLFVRRVDRWRWLLWTLLSTGTFSTTDARGLVLHQDTFPLQTQGAAVPWATSATAKPTQDIKNAQLKYRGQSVDFGSKAKLYVNLSTANDLMNNTNPNDLFGKRTDYGATVNNLEAFNKILMGNNLPQIVIYDKSYIADDGTVTTFIPNNTAILIGARTNGARLGNLRLTRNANNDNCAPGAYTRVIDLGQWTVPRRIDVHDGFNGGPVIFFPGAVVVFTV